MQRSRSSILLVSFLLTWPSWAMADILPPPVLNEGFLGSGAGMAAVAVVGLVFVAAAAMLGLRLLRGSPPSASPESDVGA